MDREVKIYDNPETCNIVMEIGKAKISIEYEQIIHGGEYNVVIKDKITPEEIFNTMKPEDFSSLCTTEELSESFMDFFKDLLDWEAICRHQNLTEEFIEKMKKYTYPFMRLIFRHQDLSTITHDKYTSIWQECED